MRIARRDIDSEFVHVTLRGIGRRYLFDDDHDRRRFLRTLRRNLPESRQSIYAWCLMDNHVHLLCQGSAESLSKLLQRVGTSYAQYFNGRHGHVGKVFQNRFHSQAIISDSHLLAAIRYIHRNPLEFGSIDLKTYPWSSYAEIVSAYCRRGTSGICDTEKVMELFDSLEAFRAFHRQKDECGYAYRLEERRSRLDQGEARKIAIACLGKDFVDMAATLPRAERDAKLRLLKESGLSVRQIERITGIGRGIIARA